MARKKAPDDDVVGGYRTYFELALSEQPFPTYSDSDFDDPEVCTRVGELLARSVMIEQGEDVGGR